MLRNHNRGERGMPAEDDRYWDERTEDADECPRCRGSRVDPDDGCQCGRCRGRGVVPCKRREMEGA